MEKAESIATSAGERDGDLSVNEERLAFSKVDGPGVTLAYQADDKAHVRHIIPIIWIITYHLVAQKEPVEALFRSLLLVLMDNATAESTFIKAFFCEPSPEPFSPDSFLLSPDSVEDRIPSGSDFAGFTQRPRADSMFSTNGLSGRPKPTKDEQAVLNAIWKQIMEPALSYCQVCLSLAIYHST